MIDELGKEVSKGKVGEGGRKVIDWLIKVVTENEGAERGREVVDGKVEASAKVE